MHIEVLSAPRAKGLPAHLVNHLLNLLYTPILLAFIDFRGGPIDVSTDSIDYSFAFWLSAQRYPDTDRLLWFPCSD